MSTIIVYPSAAEYWLSNQSIGSVKEFSKPIHIMVPDANSRRFLKDYVYHVQPKNLPEGSFIDLDPLLSICSPELCFLEAALAIKSLHKLVCFANDLCAMYVKDESKLYQQRQRKAVTSTSAIRRFLEDVDGVFTWVVFRYRNRR
jgi:hypothetical protein